MGIGVEYKCSKNNVNMYICIYYVLYLKFKCGVCKCRFMNMYQFGGECKYVKMGKKKNL